MLIYCYYDDVIAVHLNVDVSVTERGKARRRLALSTVFKETRVDPIHCQIPIGFIKRAMVSSFLC